jgi:hypothetical protein
MHGKPLLRNGVRVAVDETTREVGGRRARETRTKAADTVREGATPFFPVQAGFSGENYRTERDLPRSTSITNQASRLSTFPVALTFMWSSLTPELTAQVSRHSRARRRKVVTDAVSAVLAV